MAETDRVFVDHTELNVLERLFYPPISAPSTKIGRNKMHSFGDLLPGIKCHTATKYITPFIADLSWYPF